MHFRILHSAVVLTVVALAACAPDPRQPQARQRQMDGLLEKFDRFDTNGNGSLTRTEIRNGVADMGTLRLTNSELDTVMAAYDTDRNGHISQAEARRAAARGPVIFSGR